MKIRALVFILSILVLCTGCKKEQTPAPVGSTSGLVMLLGSDVTTFDPQIPFDESSIVLGNIFENLVEFDSNFQLSPGLATRWTNPDDRTWRFYLNPEARFSDGSRLKASDVKFSIERLKGLSHSDLQGFTEHIASIEVVDPVTVDIKTDIPFSILNNLVFIPVLSGRHVTSVEDKIGESPMGTGPYRLVKWEKEKSIVLEKNSHYDPAPSIGRVQFVIIQDPEKILDTLLTLKPDFSDSLQFRKVDEYEKKKDSNHRIVFANGISVYYFIFSLKPHLPDFPEKNPLSDVRVRKAISFATDLAETVKIVTNGHGRIPTQMIAPEIFGFDPSIPAPVYDAKKAQQLLAAAGYSNLTVPLYASGTGTHRLENATIEQWAKAGIKGVLKVLPDEEFLEKQSKGELPVSMTGYSCTSGDASEILSFNLHSRDGNGTYGKGNFAFYSNPEIDRLTEDNLRTFNPRERLEMLQKAMNIVRQDVPYLPILIFDDMYVVSNRVAWTPPVSGEVRARDFRFKEE